MILGVDEVGRGCWAGPLVMGAVVLGDVEIEGLTDSKALSARRRKELAAEIYEKAIGVGLGWVSAQEIDEIGLGAALRLACRRAVEMIDKTGVAYHEIIIDGTVNFLKGTPKAPYVTTMKKADLLIASASAASIVAKVARDNWMAEQVAIFPGYGFEQHVGYGTAPHRAALGRLGACELHRMSFAPLAKFSKFESTDPAPPRVTRSAHSGGLPTTRAIGDASESIAASELEHRGHTIIARNWKTKYCEIDIVSQKGRTVYFTEVKHRKNARHGDGLVAITSKKLNQMRYAAKFYAHTEKLEDANLQLLAIATIGDPPHITDIISID